MRSSARLVPAGLVIAVGVVLLAAACGGSGTSRNDIVFVSSRDGVYRLYGMEADGGHQHALTHGKSDSSAPRAVFYEIDPAWSQDGRSIAFSSTREGPYNLFVVGSDGSDTRRLTSTSVDDTYPTWSPDGKRIAFVHGFPGEIEIVNAEDGKGVTRVTGGQAELTGPAWSPDGRWIAYARREPGSPLREIWLVHPDGSGRHVLTSLGAVSYWPAWSPDGKHVAFVSDRSDSFDVYTIGVDGRGLRRVTSSPEDDFQPSWSADGKTIAFAREGAIMTVTPTGTDEQTLTKSENNDSDPAWNPSPASK